MTRLGSRERRLWVLWLACYNVVLVVAFPWLIGWLAYRTIRLKKRLGTWRHKLGLVPRAPEGTGPRIWLHAVSAGEMGALQPVFTRLRAALPEAYLAVSTITPTGLAAAERGCAGADAIFYLPFDWAGCIGLALGRVRPDLVVVTERELWPNFLGLARLRGAAVLVVNGRISDRQRRRARRFPRVERVRHQLPSCLCVQSEVDAARLGEMGVPEDRVLVTGNTKADSMGERDPEAEAALAGALGVAPEESWLVAGSTHAGEEDVVLAAFGQIRERLPGARLLLAPRHLERLAEVSARVAAAGFAVARRSEGTPPGEAVVVLDTMGELRSAYALGPVGFVGGTLAPIGGHNLLEPVAAGRAVVFGPHTEYCADVAALVLRAGVGFRVATAESLAEAFVRVVSEAPLRAQIAQQGPALIASQQGAALRCVNVAQALLRERDGG